MKTIDEILDEWYPTIPDEEHNGLYARGKVKLIAQEFADQFRQPAVISSKPKGKSSKKIVDPERFSKWCDVIKRI